MGSKAELSYHGEKLDDADVLDCWPSESRRYKGLVWTDTDCPGQGL